MASSRTIQICRSRSSHEKKIENVGGRRRRVEGEGAEDRVYFSIQKSLRTFWQNVSKSAKPGFRWNFLTSPGWLRIQQFVISCSLSDFGPRRAERAGDFDSIFQENLVKTIHFCVIVVHVHWDPGIVPEQRPNPYVFRTGRTAILEISLIFRTISVKNFQVVFKKINEKFLKK